MQVTAKPAAAVQGVHEEPQVLTDELLTHRPLQLCSPAGHEHWPPMQLSSELQARPHTPQFNLSELTVTHCPLHSEVPMLHRNVQRPFTHESTAPLMPDRHT